MSVYWLYISFICENMCIYIILYVEPPPHIKAGLQEETSPQAAGITGFYDL